MPIPSPTSGEEQDKFISRCMGDSAMLGEFPEQDQRAAVCHKQWRHRRQKSSNGYEYQEREDGRIVVFDVPTYWTHSDAMRSEPFDNVTEALVRNIADGTQRRLDVGAYPQLYIGPHIQEVSTDDTHRETQLVGYVENCRVTEVDTEDGKQVGIVGDYVFTREAFEFFVRNGLTPRRSAEIIRQEASKSGMPYLLNVTLLGVSMPALAAKDMIAFAGVGEGDVESYTFGSDSDMALSEEMQSAVQTIVNSALESFADKYGLVVKNQGEGMPDDKKDKDKEDNGVGPLPPVIKPNAEDKDKDKSKEDNADLAAVKEAYEARDKQRATEIEALQKEVASVRAERQSDKVRHSLTNMVREGYQFDIEGELKRLRGMSPDDCDAEIKRMRENYKQVPIKYGMNTDGVETGEGEGAGILPPEELAERKVEKRAAELVKNSDGKLRYHEAKSRAREEMVGAAD